MISRAARVWILWGIVLVVGLLGLFLLHTQHTYNRAIEVFEARVGSARHADYVLDPVADSDNAALAFPAAVGDLELTTEWSHSSDPALWSPTDYLEVRRFLARERNTVVALQTAGRLEHCRWPGVPPNQQNWSSAFLRASRLIRLEGFVGVLSGDEERVRRSVHLLERLGDCLFSQPHIIGSLVGIATERASLEVVHAVVGRDAVSPELLEYLADRLRRPEPRGRVDRAVAVEGAFALFMVENPDLVDSAASPKQGVYPVFSRRVAAELARRWADLADWSKQPLEDLLAETTPAKGRIAMAAVIADLLIPNIRDVVIRLRSLERLRELALVAVETRIGAAKIGRNDPRAAEAAGVTVLDEGDGAVLLLDSRLAELLRARYVSADRETSQGVEATLDLTVWRLPPPTGSLPYPN